MGNEQSNKNLYLLGRIPTNPIALEEIRYLVFGIGSIRGLAFVAAYKKMLQLCRQKNVDLYGQLKGAAGTSVGAIMSLGVCLNIAPNDMYQFFDPLLMAKLNKNYVFEIKCNRMSMISPEPIRQCIKLALANHGFSEKVTFVEFFNKTGKDLRIGAHNMQTDKAEMFSAGSSPNNEIVDAVMASCSMPFIFPAERTGKDCNCYVDGGVSDNFFPLREFPIQCTLGFHLYSQHRNKKLSDVLFLSLSDVEKNRVITIDASKLDALDFQPIPKLKRYIAEQGKLAIKTYFKDL
jgi:predicted acylesterase/phospholipase RssA